ncbi:MAG TPA: hypothetical protein VN673_18725, partial [Clostridia bacterium]|nr:hypothetical protein [Clostridia bacterium]
GVKGLAGVSGPIIEKHEQAAGVTFVLLLGLGLGALASLLWFRGRKVIPSWSHVSLLAVSIIVVGSGFWTANLGGQVRHTEIRPSAVATPIEAGHDRD